MATLTNAAIRNLVFSIGFTIMNESIHSPRIFKGRERELQLLEKWFKTTPGNHWFLALTGQGGIGKSQLLEKFAGSKRNEDNTYAVTSHLIDLYWTAHQTETGILRSLAAQLGQSGAFTSFNELLDRHGESRDLSDEVRNAFLEGYKQLGQKLTLLLFDTLEVASDSAIRFFLQTAPQIKSANPNTRILVAGREIPSDLAACSFLQKLRLGGLTLSDFIDYLGEAIRAGDDSDDDFKHINDVPGDVIEKVHKVTSGRPMWAGLFADWIKAGNEPTQIDTSTFQAFRENVLQPIQDLRAPEDAVILAMAHLSRRCNERILSHVLSAIVEDLNLNIPEIVQKLSRFSFVKYREPVGNDLNSCLLHDEMRDLIRDHFWKWMDQPGDYRKNLSRKAVDFYTQEIKRVELESPANILALQDLKAERLYYSCDVDPNEAFEHYLQLFSQAKSTDTREELNSEITTAQKAFDFKLTPSLRHQHCLRLAQVEHQRERYTKAIEVLSKLEAELVDAPNQDPEVLANARWRLVMALTLNGEIPKAIEQGKKWATWLESQIDKISDKNGTLSLLTQQLAPLYSQLGLAYRKQGKSNFALDYYTKALELYEKSDVPKRDEVASTRINLAYVYHELGKTSEAFDHCSAAFYTYEKLGDPYQLGRVHNVWGLVYDGIIHIEAAQSHFDKALQYFQEARNRRGQGMCQVAQARMLRREEGFNLKTRKVVLTKSGLARRYNKINKLLDAALTNLRGGDQALLAIALNEKGTLLREMHRFDDAIRFFEDSNKIADRIANTHRKADNLQDIAQTYFAKSLACNSESDLDKALMSANEAVTLSENCHPQISGRARRTIANVLFEKKDYDGAFEAIRLSSTEIVQMDTDGISDSPERKRRLYKEWRDWVLDLLRKCPSEIRESKITLLKRHWNNSTVDGKALSLSHPSFISALESLPHDDSHTSQSEMGSNLP